MTASIWATVMLTALGALQVYSEIALWSALEWFVYGGMVLAFLIPFAAPLYFYYRWRTR